MSLLEELSQRLLKEESDDFSKWTIVFPNKRAGLFFKKLLSQQINKPIWTPGIVSISDLFEKLSPYEIADKFSLVFKLYKILEKCYSKKESFEQFFYWGESLLSDFDELDKYLVNPTHLFKDLRNVKDLESNLPFLDENQIKWIIQYWKSFGDVLTKNQQETLSIWNILLKVYNEFSDELINENRVYQGMAYRWVGENIDKGLDIGCDKIIFAGFNALSISEEKLMKWCMQNMDCEIYWDADDFYLRDEMQEAGFFLRQYQSSSNPFASTFKPDYKSASFKNREIRIIECSTDTGQAQEAGKVLIKILSQGHIPEKTGIILPNEKLLLPILDVIPEDIDALNVTMGYPLQNSLTFSYLISLLELQKEVKNNPNSYYYKSVVKVLNHPFVFENIDDSSKSIIQQIKKENILFPDQSFFDVENEIIKSLFRKVNGSPELIQYLQDCLMLIIDRDEEHDFEGEFAFHFYRLLNNLKDLCASQPLHLTHKSFIRLLNHAIYRERLPFEGEPLNGLQIMGFMETRNLHFDHVILLSANEGTLPPSKQEVSFIPYAVRKAYGIPTIDHSDSIFAYLFYRLIHNCKSMTIIYNSNSEKGSTGEISRFVKQLELESSISIKHSTQSLLVLPSEKYSIQIQKTADIFQKLSRYTLKEGVFEKRLSPSALNTYLECSLRFYFRYVLDLYEDEEVEENIKERELGLLFHRAIELIYAEFDKEEGNRLISVEVIDDLLKNIDLYLNKAFSEHFYSKTPDKLQLSGQSELAFEVIKELAEQVLKIDKSYAPFEIIGVESSQKAGYQLDIPVEINNKEYVVGIKGIIDRIDKKENIVRIIDYKTGRDTREFPDINSLFDPENKSRNKAVFQTFLYALFYINAFPSDNSILQAGLFNLKDMYQNDFDILIKQNHQSVEDIRPLLDEYKNKLTSLVQNIFNPEIGFVQTTDERKCSFCPYNQICNRESK